MKTATFRSNRLHHVSNNVICPFRWQHESFKRFGVRPLGKLMDIRKTGKCSSDQSE